MPHWEFITSVPESMTIEPFSAEQAGRTLINILRNFLATEKDYRWLETIYCVLRRYHRTNNYTGLSPNELVFGREKMGPGPVMYHRRQCYDASQWFDKIKELDSKWIQAKVESQADWLKFKNQARMQGKPSEKGQQIWLFKSDDTLKDHSMTNCYLCRKAHFKSRVN